MRNIVNLIAHFLFIFSAGFAVFVFAHLCTGEPVRLQESIVWVRVTELILAFGILAIAVGWCLKFAKGRWI